FYQKDEKAFARVKNDLETHGSSEGDEELVNSSDSSAFGSLDPEQNARVLPEGQVRKTFVRHDRFYTLPDKALFGPFLKSASRAVARLP
ncbi:hypothetical protein PMIN07_001464, partial [Paraphaeosphaeria minitans]